MCVDDEEIFDELTGKAECVYKKLENLSGGFKKAIQKFDGEFPVSHLKLLSTVPKNSNANASTSPPKDYIIKIKINPNKLNRPNLSIARTIIHEVIHAEMWRKIMSLIKKGTITSINSKEWTEKLSKGDYPGIFDYYSRFGVNKFQHQQMAAYYRGTIIHLLKEFDPTQTEDVYEALSWVGLRGTWNKNTSKNKQRLTDKNNYLPDYPTEAWRKLTKEERKTLVNRQETYRKKGGEPCL